MQSAKLIDVTRSFIPVDPNAYPENMHGTDKEDSPERRVPVIPYIGHNFLPTAAGYKSFFGTNAALDLAALGANADHIFIFQTETYVNCLIALCDTGIYVKSANENGLWVQLITLAAPAVDAFAEWTYCTIKNAFYAFRTNGAAYYKAVSDLGDNPVIFTSHIPTFITVASQIGLFKLGSRLGFWDGDNSIAWGSPDDLSDFTPAVLTGANVTKFNSILGKIAAIRTQGRNAVVYASKSVTLLEVQPAETFLVKAKPLLTGTGTAFLRQSVESEPDNTHFCYTDTGIYKLHAGAEPEVIVPEVYDYLKPYTAQPIYLRLLQGRFLCFEIIDANALNGKAQFSKVVIPSSSVLFPANDSLEAIHDADIADVNMCDVISQISAGTFAETAADAAATVGGNRMPGTPIRPLYTCYLSLANGPVEPITWASTPCGPDKINGAGKFTPSPSTNGGKLSQFTTDATNKTAKTGDQVWIDGKWTMERFVAYQTAIWRSQERALEEYVTQIKNRTEPGITVTTLNTTSCVVASDPPYDSCLIGRYPTQFSPYQFGFNKCSFWLTRYALGAEDIYNKTRTTTACLNTTTSMGAPDYYYLGYGPTDHFASPAAACAAVGKTFEWLPGAISANVASIGTAEAEASIGYAVPAGADVHAHWTTSTGKVYTSQTTAPAPSMLPTVYQAYPAGHWDKVQAQNYHNEAVTVDPLTPTPETAWCEITGWEYINTAGVKSTVAATACGVTNDKYPGAAPSITRQVPNGEARPLNVNPEDGGVCGLPFEQPDIGDPVEWDDQTVTYPASSFLLQAGSIAPKNPTFVGAFVYDLHLKKWGKMKLEYKQLLDYSPINSVSSSPIDFTVFGILAGVLKADGLVYIFDNNPADSSITWGKIGYYRAGMTDLEEIRVDFASLSTGMAIVDLSLDGQSVGSDVSYSESFTSAKQIIVYPPYSGKWFNFTLTGKFDVSYLECKGFHKGRR